MKKFLQHQKGFFSTQQKHEMNLSSHFHAVLFLLLALLAPWTAKAQTTVTIGTGTTQNAGLPLMMEWNYSMTQQIYTAAEIGQAGLIQSIAFDYAYTQPFSLPGIKVYMKNVSKNTFDNSYDMVAVSESDKVFEGTFAANGAGWVTLTLDTPFYYDGTSNLLVCFYDCTSGFLGNSYKFNCTISTNGSLSYYIDSFSLWYFDIQELKANYNSNAAKGNYRNNIRLTFNNNGIITFADPNVKQICVQNWDTNNDGELSYAEAAAVTSLGEVFKQNTSITSFNELQYFTGLTSINNEAFLSCSGLESITLPNSVTIIGTGSFQNCINLTSIPIGNGITNIYSFAFAGCYNVTSLVIPSSIESIGFRAFSSGNMTSITVDANNAYYDSRNGCNAIIETATNTLILGCINTIIPDNVTSIGTNAFFSCNMTSIVIPNSVTSMANNAFWFCDRLTSMTVLATTPPVLGFGVFDNVPIDIPVYVPYESLEAYQTYDNGEPWGGFTNFVGIVTIGNETSTTFNYAQPVNMYYHYSLTQQIYTSAELGNKAGCITSIAFEYTHTAPFSMEGVKVYMKNVSKTSFDSATDMVDLSDATMVYDGTFEASGAGWVTLQLQTPFSYDGTNNLLLCCYDPTYGYPGSAFKFRCTSTTNNSSLSYYSDSYIPDINNISSFSGNKYQRQYRNNIRLTMGNNIQFADPNVKQICVQNWDTNGDGELSYDEAAAVTSLGEVFKENSEITSFNELQYFTGIQSIGEEAFAYCYQLASITFPQNLSFIGDYAFVRCALTSVTLPFTVFSIGYNPFSLCEALESITMGAGPNNYLYCEGNAIIDINHTLLVGCKNTVIPEGVSTIGSSAFYGCTGLTAIDLPNTVTSIGSWAFNNCTGLTAFTIPASVTSIGTNAFYFDTNIAEMTVLATTPPTLGDWVFPTEIADIPVYVPCGAVEAYQTFHDGYPWGSTTFNGTTDVGFTNFQCRAIEDFPYVDGFDTDGEWLLINGDLTNRWVWGEAGVRNDPHLYISNNDGTSNQYTITSAAMVYAAKPFHFEEGWYSFQYDWLAYGEKNWDYLRVALVPTSVELSAGTSAPSVPSGSFYNNLPSGWIALDGGQQLSLNSWWQTTYREINVPSGDYYMVFAWRNDNSMGTQPPAAIDNVSIRPLTCLTPTQLTAQFVGATQVTLDWTPSGDEDEWEVWLSWDNGNETLYVPYTATTHPFTLTGLTAGRTYTANVYAVCGPGNASLSSNEISFTTSTNLCDNPITLPFTENFDGYTGTTSGSVNILPNCWSRINTTTASNFTGYPSIFEYSSYAHSGNNFLFFMSNYNNDDDPQDQYAILPVMENTNGMALNLYARAVASNRVAYFEVGVMTDPTDASTFTELASYQPTSTTYTYYSIPLGFHIGDGIYIAIKMPATSSEVQYRGVCIDDITIEPLCDPEDQCSLTFTLTDSYGDTWNGNAINVVDVETGVVLASMTNVTNDHASAPITETYALAVCDGRELRFDWVMGNYTSECSYTITDANGTVILQGTGSSSMNTGDVLGTYTVSCAPMPIFLTDGDWNDASHWNTGMVPPAGSDVIIRANATVPAGYTVEANEVTLDGGSITVADGGQLKHNTPGLVVTMKKNIEPYAEINSLGNYYLLAFPFYDSNQIPASMSSQVPACIATDEGCDFYRYDPYAFDAEWRNHKQTPVETVYMREGYLYANSEPVELSLTGGTISAADESMTDRLVMVDPSNFPTDDLHAGWELLGNPFTYNAYVYSRNSDNELVPLPIMMYDADGELQTIYGGPVAPLQGFFVHVTETTTVCFRGNALHEDDYVDLGLPSGTLWATCNVGASSPEDYGDYFAWGETQPKDNYGWDNYLYYNGSVLTKYTESDGLTILEPSDDAAAANWGSDWRMPTEEELQELYDNTTHVWTTQNGVYGRLFTANKGNSLFLPAAGYRYGSSLYNTGGHGYYWLNSLNTDWPNNARSFYLGSGDYGMGTEVRSSGFTVRPVRSGGGD